SYTDDFKSQAVALFDSIGRAKAARQLGIPVKSLANWVTAANAGRPLRSPKRKPVDELESELSRAMLISGVWSDLNKRRVLLVYHHNDQRQKKGIRHDRFYS